MAKTKLRNSTDTLLDTVFDAMREKKAENILLLDLTEIKGANFDYFVIAHGNSNTQVNAIAEEVRRQTKTNCKQNPAHAEGFANSEWILLDYLNVVVHIFQKEVREHYQLENLWADAQITPIKEGLTATPKTVPPARKTTQKENADPIKKTRVKKDLPKAPRVQKKTNKLVNETRIQSKRKPATRSKSTSSSKSSKTKI